VCYTNTKIFFPPLGDDCTWLERDVPEAGTSTSWFTSEGATNGDARSRLDGAYLGTYYVRFNGRDYVENESGYLAIKPFEGTVNEVTRTQ